MGTLKSAPSLRRRVTTLCSRDNMFCYMSGPMTTSTLAVAMPTSLSFPWCFCASSKTPFWLLEIGGETFVSVSCCVQCLVVFPVPIPSFVVAVSSDAPSLCVPQCLWIRGPENRRDGEDVEGSAARKSQAYREQSEFMYLVLHRFYMTGQQITVTFKISTSGIFQVSKLQ